MAIAGGAVFLKGKYSQPDVNPVEEEKLVEAQAEVVRPRAETVESQIEIKRTVSNISEPVSAQAQPLNTSAPRLIRERPSREVEPQIENNNLQLIDSKVIDPKSTNGAKIEKSENSAALKQLFYIWMGLGTNFLSLTQTDTDGSDLNFQSTPKTSHFLKVGGFVSKDLPGMELSYKYSPGSVSSSTEVSVINGQYSWETLSAETLFVIREDSFDPAKLDKTLTARLGVQQHFTPYFATQPSGSVEVRRNSITNASLGFELILGAKHTVRYEFLGRYQYPIASAGGGGNTFSVSPKFAFDGSVGIAGRLSKNLFLGAYWYGQWNQYSFSYYDKANSISNSGRESLFYTNFELRLGYVFE